MYYEADNLEVLPALYGTACGDSDDEQANVLASVGRHPTIHWDKQQLYCTYIFINHFPHI